jgi:predicted transcriptional regulator
MFKIRIWRSTLEWQLRNLENPVSIKATRALSKTAFFRALEMNQRLTATPGAVIHRELLNKNSQASGLSLVQFSPHQVLDASILKLTFCTGLRP